MLYKFNLIPLIILLSASVLFFGCKRKTEADKLVISIKGSDTMVNLSQRWAESYMQKYKNVSIQVTGGGSGVGVASLINGTTDISNSSRELKEEELNKAKNNRIDPKIFEVALDGIAIIVHPSNSINELTLEQIRDLFTGKIKNWKQLGGSDTPVNLYGRESSSGTYAFFKEHVLGKDSDGQEREYATSTQTLQGTAALGESVAKDSKGIAYGGVGYFAKRKDVKILAVKKDADSPAILPAKNNEVNYEAIWNNEYSISRYLYCFTNGSGKKGVQEFLDWIVSKEGQDLVKTMEYIPLPEKK